MEGGYRKLALALSINAVLMFAITYFNVADLDHVHPNINRVYMALMMAAPMGIIMLLVMSGMFGNKGLNVGLFLLFAALFVGTFALVRTQTPVGNEQFLHSMIPHHSSAILMCEQSAITDPEIERLCEQIVRAQKEEIAQMKDILRRY